MLQRLSTDDKVGQLLLAGFSGSDAEDARTLIEELRVGAIVLVSNARSAEAAAELTAGLQQIAREAGLPPLLIAIDHEGGPVQRLRAGVTSLGPNWELGQVEPLETALAAACSRGATHGRELRALGINMDLAPVLDVWDNPLNTVIAERSYSSDPETVARLGAAYVEALQAEQVLAVGKHFPGHGSTTEDSHLTLPVLSHDWARLETVELVPFRSAIRAGVAGVMTAHVSYPNVDPVESRPASLSPVIVSELLRGALQFRGLVITDDLAQMRAITSGYEAGEAAVQAIVAGSDLLTTVGPLETQQQMVAAVRDEVGNRISASRLDDSVRRVLAAKQRAGLIDGGLQPALAVDSACAI